MQLLSAAVTQAINIVIDFTPVAAPEGEVIDGVLGADFLQRFVVELDYRHQELRLHDPGSFAYRGTGTIVPFRMNGAFIIAKGSVTLADGATVPGEYVVDVGSSLALALAKPYVEANSLIVRVGATTRRPSGRGVGGTAFANIGRVPMLHIGDVAVPRPVTELFGDSAGVFSTSNLGDGNIGGDILRRYTVTFDYARKQMVFESHDRTNEP